MKWYLENTKITASNGIEWICKWSRRKMNSFGFSLPSVSDAVGSGDREGLSFLKVKVNHRTLFFFFWFFRHHYWFDSFLCNGFLAFNPSFSPCLCPDPFFSSPCIPRYLSFHPFYFFPLKFLIANTFFYTGLVLIPSLHMILFLWYFTVLFLWCIRKKNE